MCGCVWVRVCVCVCVRVCVCVCVCKLVTGHIVSLLVEEKEEEVTYLWTATY